MYGSRNGFLHLSVKVDLGDDFSGGSGNADDAVIRFPVLGKERIRTRCLDRFLPPDSDRK